MKVMEIHNVCWELSKLTPETPTEKALVSIVQDMARHISTLMGTVKALELPESHRCVECAKEFKAVATVICTPNGGLCYMHGLPDEVRTQIQKGLDQ
jgi:hypothetical protein